MNAQEFVTAWIEFIEIFLSKHQGGLVKAWDGKTVWTRSTIGPAWVEQLNSPLGCFLKNRLGSDAWRYQKEYRTIDLVLSNRPNLPKPYLWQGEEEEARWGYGFHPEALDIVIEHEDACGISWQEMVKLVHVRAPLKVLITYTKEVDIRQGSMDYSKTLIERTRSMFLDIIQQTWTAFPEDPCTTYLLIIGQLDESGARAQLVWHHTIYTYENGAVRARHQSTVH